MLCYNDRIASKEAIMSSEQWLPMREVAESLHISYDKLSRLVRQKVIRTQSDVLDQRKKLVEINEVRHIFRV
jgi:hypothetical protein